MSSILLAIIVLLVCLGGIYLSIRIYKILIRIQSKQEAEEAKKSEKE